MQLHISDTAEELYAAAAEWIAAELVAAVEKRGHATIALSGGNTPKAVYQILATPPYDLSIPWKRIHFFWGDERMVAYGDGQNNAKMAIDALLDPLAIPHENIHRMPSELVPADAEKAYAVVLQKYFPQDSEFSFDIVLLGMGDDGHTLSLFPAEDVLTQEEGRLKVYFVKKFKQYRMTLLPGFVNKCRLAAFIISGPAKASAFREVVSKKNDPKKFPAQLIRPVNGELHWFADEAAVNDIN